MAEQGGLPGFVEEEFQAYLGCGRLEAGCLELTVPLVRALALGGTELLSGAADYEELGVFTMRKRLELQDSTSPTELVWC